MKNILVLEDNHQEYRVIREALNMQGFKVFPRVENDNFDPLINLYSQCTLYVLKKEKEPERKIELIKFIRTDILGEEIPDLFIVDLSLRSNYEDKDGGIIRKDILHQMCPEVKCIFLTGYSSQSISAYKFPGDEYIGKYKDGAKNFRLLVKTNLVFMVRKVLNIL